MKRNNKIIMIVLLAIVVVLMIFVIVYRFQDLGSPKEVCLDNGLTWLEDYGECEFMSQDTCEFLGGTFNECGSACRHNPEVGYCVAMCVPFCSFGF